MPIRCVKSDGVVLLLIVLVLLGISAAALFTGLVANKSMERRIADGTSADQRLLFARDALLGFAIGNISDSGRPGQLPVPDNLHDGNYDGTANVVVVNCLDGSAPNGLPALSGDNANLRCIGKLPWKTLGISLDGADENDSTGIVPWYAVSANLAASTLCLTYLNPTTIGATPVPFGCPSDSAPPYPWLKVCDQTGRLLSDRVAFVLIVPGAPLPTTGRMQTRTGTPRPQPADYLDAIPVPAGWGALAPSQRCATYDNATLSNEFVTADTTSAFNDRLLYVTVDELMARVESRVAQQVREALVSYETAYGRYPWLAPISNPTSVTDSFIALSGANAGLVPFHTSTNSQRFKTELAWEIGTLPASDTVSPTTSSSPGFFCFGSTYRCRIRTSPGTTTILRTVTAAEFAALKISAVATPSVSCSYSTLTVLNCDTYSYTLTQAVTYDVQRRLNPPNSGAYTYYGTYPGVRTRTITVLFTAVQASGAATFSSDGAFFVRRSLTTNSSMFAGGILSVVDTWTPNTPGAAPFDLTSSLQTGSAVTNGVGVVTASNIRVYPQLPRWYTDHKWHEFIYAAISPDASPSVGGHACSANCFSAGTRGGVNALVISSGKQISPQNRYAAMPSVTDFLEAPNSTGTATRTFADTNTSQTGTYADTIATIPR